MDKQMYPLYGFFIGLLAGATTGILMAPDKGKRTRKKITRRVEKLEDDIEKLWGKVSNYK